MRSESSGVTVEVVFELDTTPGSEPMQRFIASQGNRHASWDTLAHTTKL